MQPLASIVHAPDGVEAVTWKAPSAVGADVGTNVGAGAAVGAVGAAESTSAAQIMNPADVIEKSESLRVASGCGSECLRLRLRRDGKYKVEGGAVK